ncbi:MAG: MarR family transcriptional regulator [Desulfobacteraceae bacterium]|nr:MarR family transcriptional regulator [Desulfobacteraceae bacterium]
MPLKVDDCIFFMLARASQAGTRFWANCLSDMGITAVQAMVLNFLGDQDSVTSKELSERTGLDGATLTGVLDRLKNSGLIQRQRHPRDRRAIHICLTGDGREMVPRIQERLNEANRQFLAVLDDGEQTVLRQMLRAIRSSPNVQ